MLIIMFLTYYAFICSKQIDVCNKYHSSKRLYRYVQSNKDKKGEISAPTRIDYTVNQSSHYADH